jgi:hypothetical protein
MSATVVTRSGRACTTERPAAGKALPIDALVVMADGSRKPMGDVVVGDRVASVDGLVSVVYGVCPQGPQPVHRITFGDGRQIEADEDHLWLVGCKFWCGPRIMTTREIVRFRAKASRYANTLHVPLASGELEAAIAAAVRPFAAQQALLMTIPGVNALTAAAIIAEIGVDMAAFGTARRLAAWAGVCPANHESAGKRKQRGTRKGNVHLKAPS